jgi:hypothetical protein
MFFDISLLHEFLISVITLLNLKQCINNKNKENNNDNNNNNNNISYFCYSTNIDININYQIYAIVNLIFYFVVSKK